MGRFLWRLREKTARFMYGRYGVDKLYWFLFGIWALLTLLSRMPFHWVAQLCLWAAATATMVFMFFRVLSRNTYKRYREGQAFDAVWNKVVSFFRLQRNRFRDRKTKVYRRCPSCKAMLRFPRVKGNHTANCPRCNKAFTVKVRV